VQNCPFIGAIHAIIDVCPYVHGALSHYAEESVSPSADGISPLLTSAHPPASFAALMHRLVLCALFGLRRRPHATQKTGGDRAQGGVRSARRRASGRPRTRPAGYRERVGEGQGRAGRRRGALPLGAILGSRVNGYGLSKKELHRVEGGFADAAEDRKLQLRDPDLEEWGPKVDAMLQRRGNPRIAGEKERGRSSQIRSRRSPAPNGFQAGSSSFRSGPETDRGRRRPTACE